jgi:hypothetical protein
LLNSNLDAGDIADHVEDVMTFPAPDWPPAFDPLA